MGFPDDMAGKKKVETEEGEKKAGRKMEISRRVHLHGPLRSAFAARVLDTDSTCWPVLAVPCLPHCARDSSRFVLRRTLHV